MPETSKSPSLYRRIMGETFDLLPSAVRDLHSIGDRGTAIGEAEVIGPGNTIGKLVALVFGMPSAGQHPAQVLFQVRDGMETWTRIFGQTSFASRLSQDGSTLVERFGLIQFRFDLLGDSTGLEMKMKGWSIIGIPLPLGLAPRSRAREWEQDCRFWFDVPISLPLVGRLVHYKGWLTLN